MSSDREKILEMVAEGIITLDEAKRLLECLSVVSEIQEEPVAEQAANADGATEADGAADEAAHGETTSIDEDTLPEVPEAPWAVKAPEEVKIPEAPTVSQTTGIPEPPKAPDFNEAVQFSQESKGDFAPKALISISGNQNQYSSAAAWVKGFKISWFSGPVEIRSYDGDVVNITEYSKDELRDEDKMEITEQNGIIQVKWDRHGSIFSLASLTRLLGRLTLSKQLVVEIPKSLHGKLAVLECSTVSGKIDCSEVAAELMNLSSTSGAVTGVDLTARRLKANSVSGKVMLEDITAGDVNINSTSGSVYGDRFTVNSGEWSSVSGSVHLAGSAERIKASTISGAVKASLHTCPESINVDTVSGGIHFTLPDNQGFTMNYNSVSSKLDTQFPITGSIGKKSGKAIYGNGKAQFRFNTVSGGMRLYYQ